MAETTRSWTRHPSIRVGLAGVAVVVLAGLGAPWLAPYDPSEQIDTVAGKYLPPLSARPAVHLAAEGWRLADRVERTASGLRIERLGRSEERPAADVLNLTADGVADRRVYLLGSDRFSRDVLSRLLWGARLSLLVGSLSLALALSIGILVGALAGLGGRILDALLMRLVDGLLTFPWLILMIVLSAFFPIDRAVLILLLGGTSWMSISRLVRSELMSLRRREFVTAARGLGAGPLRIFFRHLLPHALTPVLVDASMRIGSLILVEASLSFLGFGIPAPSPTWGNMIAEGRVAMLAAWWVSLFPGLALVGTVLALQQTSDGLRDVLDPRYRAPVEGAPPR